MKALATLLRASRGEASGPRDLKVATHIPAM